MSSYFTWEFRAIHQRKISCVQISVVFIGDFHKILKKSNHVSRWTRVVALYHLIYLFACSQPFDKCLVISIIDETYNAFLENEELILCAVGDWVSNNCREVCRATVGAVSLNIAARADGRFLCLRSLTADLSSVGLRGPLLLADY